MRRRRADRKILSNGPDWGVVYARPARKYRTGITRVGDRKAPPRRPLSEDHLAVLAELRRGAGRGSVRIANAAGLAPTFVNSALAVLALRGLAERVPSGGWRACRLPTNGE